MQNSFQQNKNLSLSSIKFPDSSTLTSAKTYNDDIQFNKRIRVSNDGNFNKNLYVNGKIYGEMASLDPLSKEYTDLRTGWPWETFTEEYNKNVDSVFAHVDIIEKAPYATESYVINSMANSNGIIRVLPTQMDGEGFPIFSDITSKYQNPVTSFIENEIFIIDKDKMTFKFQETNATSVGKVLTCLDLDGTVGWGVPNYNQISGDQNIGTTHGQSTTASFTISDDISTDSFPEHNLYTYMNLPSSASTNKNALVQNRTIAMLCGCISTGGFSSGSQPPVLFGSYSLGSEGISFQAGYLDLSSNYVTGTTTIGGGKRYSGTQQIRLDSTGIHLSSDSSGTNLWGNVFIHSRIVGTNLTQPPGSSTNYPTTDIPAVLTIGSSDLPQKKGKLIVNGDNDTENATEKTLSITGHSLFNGTVEINQTLAVSGSTSFANQVIINSTIPTEIQSDCKFHKSFTIQASSTNTASILRKLRYSYNFPSSYESDKVYYLRNDGSLGDLQWAELPIYSSGETNVVNKKTVFNDDLSVYADINYVSISPGIAGVIAASALAYELSGNDEIIGFRQTAPTEKSQFYWKFVTNTSVVYPFKILSDKTISNNLVCANTQYPALEFVTYDGNNNAILPPEVQRVFDNAIITDSINYTLSNNSVVSVTPLAPSKFKLVGDFWFRSGAVQSGSPLTWSYTIPNKGDMMVYWGDVTDISDNGKGEKMYRAVWKNFSDIMPSNLTKSTYFRNSVNIGSKNSYTYDQYNTTGISGTANAQNMKINGKIFYQYVSNFNTPSSATSPLNYVLTCIDASTGECDWRTSSLPSSGTSLTLDTLSVNTSFTSNGTNILLNLSMQAANSLAKIDNIQLKNISIMNDTTYTVSSGKILTCIGTEVINGITFGIMKLQTPSNIFSTIKLQSSAIVGKVWKCTNVDGSGSWQDESVSSLTDTFTSLKKIGTVNYPAAVNKILTCTGTSGSSPFTGTVEWSDSVNVSSVNSSLSIKNSDHFMTEKDTFDVSSINYHTPLFFTYVYTNPERTSNISTSQYYEWNRGVYYYLTFVASAQTVNINVQNPSSPKKHPITVKQVFNIKHAFYYNDNYNFSTPHHQDYDGYYFIEKISIDIYDQNFQLVQNITNPFNGTEYPQCLYINHTQAHKTNINSIPAQTQITIDAHFIYLTTTFYPTSNTATRYEIHPTFYVRWYYSTENKMIVQRANTNPPYTTEPFTMRVNPTSLYNTIYESITDNKYYNYGRKVTYYPTITTDPNLLIRYESQCRSVYYYTGASDNITFPITVGNNEDGRNQNALPSLNNFGVLGIPSSNYLTGYYNLSLPYISFSSANFPTSKNVFEAKKIYSDKIYAKSGIVADSGFLNCCGIAGRKGVPLSSSSSAIDSFGNYYGSYNEGSTYGSKFNFWWSNQGTVDIWVDYSKVVTLPMNTCDYRIKSNIKEPLPVLQRLSEIPIHSYDLNFERQLSEKESQYEGKEIVFSPNHIGPFAHELQEKFPELSALVTNEKDAVGDTGKPQFQNINHHEMIFLLMKAVQELNAEIKDLKIELDEMRRAIYLSN
jgi:hypothetical protein